MAGLFTIAGITLDYAVPVTTTDAPTTVFEIISSRQFQTVRRGEFETHSVLLLRPLTSGYLSEVTPDSVMQEGAYCALARSR